MYDQHVPVERFLPILAPPNLEMRFPETTLRSHADFKKGEYIAFKFRQQWTLVDGPGKQPRIQTYRVEAAN